jgi:hypothetical protein
MDILKARYELRRMSTGDLFKLALNWKMSNCLVGARPCGFLFQYKGNNFCVSEILGEGCQVERLEQMEQPYDEKEKVNLSLPFPQKMEIELLLPRKKAAEFKVYHRDHLTHSAVFLGKIIERRRKERGDNLKGLLSKAIKQYSDNLEDPSTIFLLEQ